MRRKLQTKAGAALYVVGKGIVEPVFGQIKQALGFRQFLLCGLEKVKGGWALEDKLSEMVDHGDAINVGLALSFAPGERTVPAEHHAITLRSMCFGGVWPARASIVVLSPRYPI